jgi:hypothetical protein
MCAATDDFVNRSEVFLKSRASKHPDLSGLAISRTRFHAAPHNRLSDDFLEWALYCSEDNLM